MSIETIDPGKWIFTERSLPGYFIYRLLEGKVSVFHSGTKINEIEVKSGDKPVLVGMISTLRQDGLHIASIRTETPIKVERIYSDQIRGILNNEIPEETKASVHSMVEAIILRNDIESLKAKLANISVAELKTPDNVSKEVKETLESIASLYNSSK